jgi:hypothetical protein
LEKAINWIKKSDAVEGALAVKGEKIALFGIGAGLFRHSDGRMAEKITAHNSNWNNLFK